MTQTIPASDFVSVLPNVLSAGGSALDLVGVLLTTSAQVPIGDVHPFADADSVGDYFGASSDEKAAAVIYFNGFDNSSKKPARIYFVQYNAHKVGAYLRGGDLSDMTLDELKALTGNLTVTIDGNVYAATGIDLSGATSFSDAASIIETAIQAEAPATASFTGQIIYGIGNIKSYVQASAVTGTIALGALLAGAGVDAGTHIVAQTVGTPGGAGTYELDTKQDPVGSEAMTTSNAAGLPTVTYDSVSGAFVIASGITGVASTISFGSAGLADDLLLREEDGAVTSQGAIAADPSTFMDGVADVTQNWATFTHIFDPDEAGENTVKLAFANWTNGTNKRYAYIPWDTDAAPTTTVPATSSLGYLLQQGQQNGTAPVWGPDNTKAVFACGMIASIDFNATNGRITTKFKSQSGLTPDVTTLSIANNLRANGYNFYGSWGTANDEFNFFAEGIVSGEFQWLDSYANEIWLNNALQLALVSLLTQINSVPYNKTGYALLDAACADPINAALNAGVIRPGVTLSAAQAAEVNNAAGANVSDTIQTIGWYLQIKDASPQVRQARGTPPMTFWYTDGESVHDIVLDSIAIQ